MKYQLAQKVKRNLLRILPFGLIWWTTGWLFLFVELAASGFKNLQPDSAITLTMPVFIFASFAITSVGLLVGFIEMVLLEKRFRNYSLARKILYKFIFYLCLLFTILLVTFPIAASIENSTSIFSALVWQKMLQFFISITFLSTIVQLSFSLLLSFLYSAVSENLGHQVLFNLISGKYHKPVIENRIFMFLDMKSSTTIAEELGHVAYFDLLQQYYDCMTDPIINHFGEVYQYIGDEVVITWPLEAGLHQSHCIQCFFSIQKKMQEYRPQFLSKFGVSPMFRAGMHVGEVSTGEVGALKKEIVFTGDVLNTTARIQGLSKEYQTDLVLSEALVKQLPTTHHFVFQKLGTVKLRGKTQSLTVFGTEAGQL